MGDFASIKAKILAFKIEAPLLMVKESEDWYQDNINLGGTQIKKNIVGKVYKRKHKYPHPVLRETRQLVKSIKSKYYKTSIKIEHRTINYRGGKTNADYGAIQNDRYGFMKDSKALARHIEKKLSRRIKNIFT